MVARLKSLFEKPKLRTWLFISFVLLFYITRTRPAEPLTDIFLEGRYGFMTAGEGGIIVLDFYVQNDEKLELRSEPIQVVEFNSSGFAHAIEVQGDLVFVANDSQGLLVLSKEKLLAREQIVEGSPEAESAKAAIIQTSGKTLDIAVGEKYAYAVDSAEDIVIIKLKNIENDPQISDPYDVPGKAQKVKIFGEYLFITNDQGQLLRYSIDNPEKLDKELIFEVGSKINNFTLRGDYLYLATEDAGFQILENSSTPENFPIGSYQEKIPTYDVNLKGNYAFVAAGKHGLLIFSVKDPSTIVLIGQERKPTEANQNFWIDDYVYVADGHYGLKVFDYKVNFDYDSQKQTIQQGQYNDVVVKDDIAYIAAGDFGLQVVDVTNPSKPKNTFYLDININNNTRDVATSLDISGDKIYLAFREEGLRVFDISENKQNPVKTEKLYATAGEANDVIIQDEIAYVAVGSAGLQVFDLKKPDNPKGYTENTPGDALGVFVMDDYAYVADSKRGLQIIQVSDPQKPTLKNTIDTPGTATAVYVAERENGAGSTKKYAFIADGEEGLFIADVTDPNNLSEVASFKTEALEYAADLIVNGQTVHLLDESDGLVTIDVKDVTEPVRLGNRSTPGNALGLFLSKNLNFVADGERGLRILDAKDKNNPVEIGFYDLPKNVTKILTDGSYAYLVNSGSGMWILSLENRNAPYAVAFYETPGNAVDIAKEGNFVYIADGDNGLNILNIEKPKKPKLAGTYADLGKTISIAVVGNNLYIGSEKNNRNEMHILNVEKKDAIKEVAVFQTAGRPNAIVAYDGYTYISEGDKGLEIVYVENLDDLDSFLASDNFNLIDTRSVEVLPAENLVKMEGHQNLGADDIIFVADGKNGMKIFNVFRPFSPSLVFEFPLDEGGEARSISALDEYAFLSAGDQGLFTFYVWDLNKIALVGEESSPPQTGVIAALSSVDEKFKDRKDGIGDNRFHNYVFTAEAALYTYQVNGQSQTAYIGEYELIGEAAVGQVFRQLLSALIHLDPSLVQEKVKTRIEYITFGLFVFVFVSIFWLLMFAWFVLPIRTFKDWRKAFARLWVSLWGKDGPSVVIKDGRLDSKPSKLARIGRGVARVDFNSAIVLERSSMIHTGWRRYYNKMMKKEQRKGRQVPRSHVEGPGVIFMQPYESLRGEADFRTQFRIRPEVQAYTRDGIEVNNPVWVLFTLGQPPEVLDVTYVGERKAENIRAIHFNEEATISARDGQKRRGLLVKNLVDELDPSDKEEIHLFVQKNILRKFFLRVKNLLSEIDDSGNPGEIIEDLVEQIESLVFRFEIDKRKDVVRFLEDVSHLVDQSKRNGVIDRPTIKWFAYRASVQADHYASEGMLAFYNIIYQLKFEQYTRELQEMHQQFNREPDEANFLLQLVEYAQQRVDQFVKNQNRDDTNREFVLTAFRTKLIIDREINDEFEKLNDINRDDILKAKIVEFQERIARVTTELVRTNYPFTGLFGHVAKLCVCVKGVNRVASQITISDEWRFPNMGDLFKIRNTVKDIQEGLDEQEKACKLEFARYLDLLIIHDFVSYVHQQLEGLGLFKTNVKKAQKTAVFIDLIQKETEKLDRVADPALQLRVQKLKELTFGLDRRNTSDVFFFGKQMDDLWQKIISAETLIVRSFLRKSQKQFDQIQKNVRQFSILVKSGVVNGEVQKYQNDISNIQKKLTACQVPDKLLITTPPKQTKVGPYLFDRQRVVAAVYSEAQDKDRLEIEAEQMHWTQLPVHVAAQTFRDLVSKEQYDYLYQPNDPHKFNLPKLKANMRMAVRNQGVLAFRFVDQIDGLPLESGGEFEPDELTYYKNRELKNPKVLRSRGIKVIASGFPDLFPVSVEMPSHQLDQWSAPWQRDAATIMSQAELRAMRVINQARSQAQSEMAYTLARVMQSSVSEEALAIRVFQALEAVAADKDSRQFLPRDTMHLLYRFRRWFVETDDPENDDPPDNFDFPNIEQSLPD